ncbi:FAD-dependent monooxygenase [Alteromonas sp. CYL-A6]|uniref:FAD-dependent monooxygenase n=1 Tax=Alteromonas nitratireducens TaxID=3390813 RepID=UPI0034B0ED71
MYDFCINGGGMVGSALALGLAAQGYQVALIEPQLPAPFDPAQPPDLRVSAISHNSVVLLDALHAWPEIAAMRLKPYTGLSVWEAADKSTSFTADMAGLNELGYFVENRLIQLGCMSAMKRYDNLTCYTGHAVQSLELSQEADHRFARITLDNETTLTARWLVGADGARSQVRATANIGTSGWQYGQQAMGILIRLGGDSGGETWQQFTPAGPKAYLPMYDNVASLIWYDSPDVLKAASSMDNAALKARLYEVFPDRLRQDCPDFSIEGTAVFPLTRSHASAYVMDPVILIGDAAHTINPLAGQGVNLGFKDVEALLSVTASHPDLSSAAFRHALIADYETPRKRDNALMMTAMDGFYHLFSNDIGPIKTLRNALLSVTESFPFGKRAVLRYALGMKKWKF